MNSCAIFERMLPGQAAGYLTVSFFVKTEPGNEPVML